VAVSQADNPSTDTCRRQLPGSSHLRFACRCEGKRAAGQSRLRVIRDRVEPAASPGMVRYAAESGSELS
jgi:hypothetical protein